jgi:YD repeat-containing protein
MTWSAGYDGRNRLTSFNRNNTTASFTYDANSNRLTSVNKVTSDTDLDGIFEATDYSTTNSQALRVASTSNKLLGFAQFVGTQRTNANGDLTSDGLRLFEYDAANRLAKVQLNRNAEASKITYQHNAQW